MYEYTPEGNKKVGLTVTAVCFLSTAILFMPNTLDLWVSTLLRSVGLWLFLCGFLVLERFVLTAFHYRIEFTGDGVFDLVITESRLKKQRTVCRVSSKDFISVKRVEKGTKTREKGVRRYNYRPDLVSKERFLLTLNDGDGRATVDFSPDKQILKFINGALND